MSELFVRCQHRSCRPDLRPERKHGGWEWDAPPPLLRATFWGRLWHQLCHWHRPIVFDELFDELEFDDFDMGDREDCDYCRGEGVVVACIDDLCAGEEECIHGDGYGPCPECRGRGFHVVPWDSLGVPAPPPSRPVEPDFREKGQGG